MADESKKEKTILELLADDADVTKNDDHRMLSQDHATAMKKASQVDGIHKVGLSDEEILDVMSNYIETYQDTLIGATKKPELKEYRKKVNRIKAEQIIDHYAGKDKTLKEALAEIRQDGLSKLISQYHAKERDLDRSAFFQHLAHKHLGNDRKKHEEFAKAYAKKFDIEDQLLELTLDAKKVATQYLMGEHSKSISKAQSFYKDDSAKPKLATKPKAKKMAQEEYQQAA